MTQEVIGSGILIQTDHIVKEGVRQRRSEQDVLDVNLVDTLPDDETVVRRAVLEEDRRGRADHHDSPGGRGAPLLRL